MPSTNNHIQWVAHRGDCEFHIENTLQSIQAAIDNGINHIEVDIQLTKDSMSIVYHDNDLNRMFAINQKVAEISFSQIDQIPLTPRKIENKKNCAYFVPTLASVVELINRYPHVTLYVEVKDINFKYFSHQHVFTKVMAVLQPIIKQIVIISFSYRFLRLIKKITHLPVAYVLPSWQSYSQKMLNNLKPEIIFADIKKLPKNEIFTTKKETWVIYEVKNVKQAALLKSKGIYWFESFTPFKLKKLYK